MQIKLVVFDLAGTTVHDNKDVHRVLKSALKEYGISITLEEANEVMGIPKPIAIEKLLRLENSPDTSEEFINDIHTLFVNKMIQFYRTDHSVMEKTGVSETFRYLRDHGIKVAVDTGFDRPITDVVLERMGWIEHGLIDASVTSDEVSNGRPFPDLIYKAMDLTGVLDVKQVAKVGDTPSDLREGIAARCGMVIGVTSGAFTKTQLLMEPHTHLIEEVPEIISILNH